MRQVLAEQALMLRYRERPEEGSGGRDRGENDEDSAERPPTRGGIQIGQKEAQCGEQGAQSKGHMHLDKTFRKRRANSRERPRAQRDNCELNHERQTSLLNEIETVQQSRDGLARTYGRGSIAHCIDPCRTRANCKLHIWIGERFIAEDWGAAE